MSAFPGLAGALSGGLGGLGLLEIEAKVDHCNIALGSRRKSLDIRKRPEHDPLVLLGEEGAGLPAAVSAECTAAAFSDTADCLIPRSAWRRLRDVADGVQRSLLTEASTPASPLRRDRLRTACRDAVAAAAADLSPGSVLRMPQPASPRPPRRRVEAYTATHEGTRGYQEDRTVCVARLGDLCAPSDCPSPLSGAYFASVYDGHGGAQCADFARERLHWELARALSDPAKDGAPGGGAVGDGLKAAFARTDAAFIEIAERHNIDAGSTATACCVAGDTLWVGNLGDSRAILVSRDTQSGRPTDVVQLTTDHNVKENKEERQAVQARGGAVIRNRVDGMLSVTRCLGNRALRDHLSQLPDITSRDVRWDADDCIVIGSDGLFERLSNEEIAETACEARAAVEAALTQTRRQLRQQRPSAARRGGSHASAGSGGRRSGDDLSLPALPAPPGAAAGDADALAASALSPSRLPHPPRPSDSPDAADLTQCSYQRVADELLARALGEARNDCDNIAVVVLLLGADSLTVQECEPLPGGADAAAAALCRRATPPQPGTQKPGRSLLPSPPNHSRQSNAKPAPRREPPASPPPAKAAAPAAAGPAPSPPRRVVDLTPMECKPPWESDGEGEGGDAWTCSGDSDDEEREIPEDLDGASPRGAAAAEEAGDCLEMGMSCCGPPPAAAPPPPAGAADGGEQPAAKKQGANSVEPGLGQSMSGHGRMGEEQHQELGDGEELEGQSPSGDGDLLECSVFVRPDAPSDGPRPTRPK